MAWVKMVLFAEMCYPSPLTDEVIVSVEKGEIMKFELEREDSSVRKMQKPVSAFLNYGNLKMWQTTSHSAICFCACLVSVSSLQAMVLLI